MSNFTVERIPRSAGAKRALGYGSVEFEVEAETEAAALSAAKRASAYDSSEFFWKITKARLTAGGAERQ